MQYLKADTATTIRIGPFVDDSDGKTAETGLTIAQADVRLSKGGAAAAQKNDATSATHDENGYYRVPLNTTDTNTEGTLDVCVSEAGALPVIAKFTVLPAEVYDSFVAGTDKLQVDLVQINGTSEGSTSIRANVVAAAGTQITSADDFKADLTSLNDPTAAAVATAVRSELTTELGRIDADITSRAAAGDAMTLTTGERSAVGTAVWDKNVSTYANAGEAGTLLKVAESNTTSIKTTDVLKANVVQISGDTTAADNLESYCDGTTPIPSNMTQISGDSTAADNLESYCDGTTPIPANTTQVAGSSVAGVADFKADVSGLPSSSQIADAVWDEAQSGHTTAGTFGLYLDAAISGVSTGGVSAADIADAVWDEALSGHTSAGSAGKALADAETDADSAATGVAGLNDPTAAAVASAVRTELATELARIDADVTSREASGAAATAVGGLNDPTAAQVATAVRSELATELGRVDATVSSRAATGDAMTLTTGERDAVAAALLDLANGVETGITTRQALRATLAALAGKVTGMDTNAPVFRAGDDSKDRITATTDANGNRSAVTLNLT